jgi:hypothetical protein
MFLGINYHLTEYSRNSKLGKEHTYFRKKTLATFRCDNCNKIFERPLKSISSKRLNNAYFHCCSDCDTKRFAQRKGVEHKTIWDLPSSVDLDISKL